MDAKPDTCQYDGCTDSVDGAFDFYFGIRWYCRDHFLFIHDIYHQTDLTVHEPIDTDTET